MAPMDVTFASASETCAALLYQAEGGGPHPGIVMAGGLSVVKEMHLPKFAEILRDAGFSVLLFDYRYCGGSSGEPRGRLHPLEQIEDYKNAISWMSQHPKVDAARLGAYGTSFSGGHVIQLAAIDPRVKCVVSQMPAVDTPATFKAFVGDEAFAAFKANLAAARTARYSGAPDPEIAIVAPQGEPALVPMEESFNYFENLPAADKATWVNRTSFASLEALLEYRPGLYADLVAPTPIMFIVAADDQVTPAAMVEDVHARCTGPKAWHALPCGHNDIYEKPDVYRQAGDLAVGWYREHLGGRDRSEKGTGNG